MKRIILAGGSGFLGRILAAHFRKAGHEIVILTRSRPAARRDVREVEWDARSRGDWTSELEGASALINLTGRSVNCRYNRANRRSIWESRIQSTRVLGEAMANAKIPPPVWLNTSTATIYKHTFGPAWAETGEIGATAEAKDEFSVAVAQAWERTLDDAPTPQTRKVAWRAAMVLGTDKNSVFPVLRRLARLGLGGRMGDGRQFVSWIHEVDFCRAMEWLIAHDDFNGPVNICAPNPVTNAELMAAFRQHCGVPFGLPATRWMLEAGALALRTETELMLKSRRVTPQRLLKSGFSFQFPLLGGALEDFENGPVS